MTITEPTADTADDQPATDDAARADQSDVVVDDDVLVEEISIDGMCGVY